MVEPSSTQQYTIQRAHQPKVAGSNPAPLSTEGARVCVIWEIYLVE